MTVAERRHWLSITDDPDWRRNHIYDPNISTAETLAAITTPPFPTAPQYILEIGCGFGRLTSEMQQRFPKTEVTGLDINERILLEAIPGPFYICDDNLQYAQRQDAIYSVAVFQHLPAEEKRAYIDQAAKVLNPQGVLRVQFIEGARDNFCDHWESAGTMVDWCLNAGFATARVQHGLVHPQWSWLTATL